MIIFKDIKVLPVLLIILFKFCAKSMCETRYGIVTHLPQLTSAFNVITPKQRFIIDHPDKFNTIQTSGNQNNAERSDLKLYKISCDKERGICKKCYKDGSGKFCLAKKIGQSNKPRTRTSTPRPETKTSPKSNLIYTKTSPPPLTTITPNTPKNLFKYSPPKTVKSLQSPNNFFFVIKPVKNNKKPKSTVPSTSKPHNVVHNFHNVGNHTHNHYHYYANNQHDDSSTGGQYQ